jgi:hypothetical protein
MHSPYIKESIAKDIKINIKHVQVKKNNGNNQKIFIIVLAIKYIENILTPNIKNPSNRSKWKEITIPRLQNVNIKSKIPDPNDDFL